MGVLRRLRAPLRAIPLLCQARPQMGFADRVAGKDPFYHFACEANVVGLVELTEARVRRAAAHGATLPAPEGSDAAVYAQRHATVPLFHGLLSTSAVVRQHVLPAEIARAYGTTPRAPDGSEHVPDAVPLATVKDLQARMRAVVAEAGWAQGTGPVPPVDDLVAAGAAACESNEAEPSAHEAKVAAEDIAAAIADNDDVFDGWAQVRACIEDGRPLTVPEE